MSRPRALELKVGLLIVVALGLLGALLFVLGDFSLGKGFRLSVDFEFTGNLHSGAPVKLAGLKVGKVEGIRFLRPEELAPKHRAYVRVGLWLEQRVLGRIYEDAEFYVNTKGVLGEQYLEIVPGTAGKRAIAAGEKLVGVTPPRFDLIVARLYEFLDRGTRLLRRDKQTISDLLRASTSAVRTVDKILATNEKQIGKLLGDADKLAGEATSLLSNVKQGLGTPRRLDRLVGNVERVTGTLGRRLDGLLDKTGKALDRVDQLAALVGKPEQQRVRKLLDKALAIGDKIYGLAGDAGTMLSRISQGKGSVGALLAKDEMYDDLKELVRDLKRNPWKFLWRQ